MFGDKLENAVQSIPGGKALILMGIDGIPVDSYPGEGEPDIETVGMEFSVLLKEVRKAIELLESGEADEFTVRSTEMCTVIRVVSDEYFLALALAADGNLGKARYVLRVLAPDIQSELL